jgi:hypothetical protein
MSAQKKKPKRTTEGALTLDGVALVWTLLSDPQWGNAGRGYKGLCLSVRTAKLARRELIIEFPYPTDAAGRELPAPQRPDISPALVEATIRDAVEDGWSPESRGKAFLFYAAPA